MTIFRNFSFAIVLSVVLSSCSKSHCKRCTDPDGTIETVNSTDLDWNLLVPNVFNSFEQSLTFYVGRSINETVSSLTNLKSSQIKVARNGIDLINISDLTPNYRNFQEGTGITIPLDGISESISVPSEILDIEITITTDTDQSLIFDGRIQYIDCNKIDVDDFDSTDCRWSCQLHPYSPLGNNCAKTKCF